MANHLPEQSNPGEEAINSLKGVQLLAEEAGRPLEEQPVEPSPGEIRFFVVDPEAGTGIRSFRGQPIAKDVCDATGIKKHRDATAELEDYMRGPLVYVRTAGGRQAMRTVTELGFMSLVFRHGSTPWAKQTARHLLVDLLPQIREAQYQPPRIDSHRPALRRALHPSGPGQARRQRGCFWRASHMLEIIRPAALRWTDWYREARHIYAINEASFTEIVMQMRRLGYIESDGNGAYRLVKADFVAAEVDALPRGSKWEVAP